MLRRTLSRHPEAPRLAYRLRAWPSLPDGLRTAGVYQAFSRMGLGPVSLRWFVEASGLAPARAQALLASLVDTGEIESIDITKYAQEGSPS